MRYSMLTIALFHCVIVLFIQVTHQRVIRDAVQPESNANRSGKRLLIYSTSSRNFLRIAGKKNITASAEETDPYAVVITTNSGKKGLTIMGEKSQLYLCILSKKGKMIAMSSPTSSTDRYYCYFKEDAPNGITTYELVKKPEWSLIFSKQGNPRRAYYKKDHKKTGFMKRSVTSNGNQR